MNELKDYILIVNNALPHSLCDIILKEYSDLNEWNQAKLNLNNEVIIAKNKRNCFNIHISNSETLKKNFDNRKKIDTEIFKYVAKLCKKYQKKFNNIQISKDSGYELLKYEKNGFFKEHIDSYIQGFRTLSCSLILNNGFKGGEFSFFNKKIIYSLKKGSAILFPSNFMYPHSVLPVKNGTRYAIVTWLV